MNILEQVKQARNEAWNAAELVDYKNLSLLERVMAGGFVYEGNTYLGIYEHLLDAIKLPERKRDPMFKDVESWYPSLEEYIELLNEQKKFYEEVHKKQQSSNQ